MAYIRAKDRIGTTVKGFYIKDVKREKKEHIILLSIHTVKGKIDANERNYYREKYKLWLLQRRTNKVKSTDISGRKFERLKAIIPTESLSWKI